VTPPCSSHDLFRPPFVPFASSTAFLLFDKAAVKPLGSGLWYESGGHVASRRDTICLLLQPHDRGLWSH
jgi:hypothetical protein